MITSRFTATTDRKCYERPVAGRPRPPPGSRNRACSSGDPRRSGSRRCRPSPDLYARQNARPHARLGVAGDLILYRGPRRGMIRPCLPAGAPSPPPRSRPGPVRGRGSELLLGQHMVLSHDSPRPPELADLAALHGGKRAARLARNDPCCRLQACNRARIKGELHNPPGSAQSAAAGRRRGQAPFRACKTDPGQARRLPQIRQNRTRGEPI